MRSCEDTCGFDISFRIAREYHDLVARVGLNRIDVAVLGIDVKTVVELDVRFGTGDDPFRFGERRVWRCIVDPIVNAKSPVVVIHEDDFIESSIDRDRAVNWVLIANRANWWTSDDAGLARLLGSRM